MANVIYTPYKTAMLKGQTGDLSSASTDVRAYLVDSADYTVNTTTHEFLSSIAGGARVAASGALTGKTVSAGVFDATDVTIAGVTGDSYEYIILVEYTGVDATSRLIAKIDTATSLPATPDGNGVTIAWSASGIFAL